MAQTVLVEAEVAVLYKAVDGGHCLSGRKEVMKIAWLIPFIQPRKAYLQRQGALESWYLGHRILGQAPVYRMGLIVHPTVPLVP